MMWLHFIYVGMQIDTIAGHWQPIDLLEWQQESSKVNVIVGSNKIIDLQLFHVRRTNSYWQHIPSNTTTISGATTDTICPRLLILKFPFSPDLPETPNFYFWG